LAFCLVDGSVLSAPYDPEQTQRVPPPRTTSSATEVLAGGRRLPPQSTIHAPAPPVPPLHPASLSIDTADSPKKSILLWLLISCAIVVVGIFGAWIIASRLSAVSVTSSRNQSSPEPMSSAVPTSKTMCGQTVSVVLFEKWNEMGSEAGSLGCPINQQTDAPASPQGSKGRWIRFAKSDGGYLVEYTRSDDRQNLKPEPLVGRAFEVTGCIFKLYASLGGTKSWLGFPIGDGHQTTTGARQDFEGGYVVWDSKTYNCEAHKN